MIKIIVSIVFSLYLSDSWAQGTARVVLLKGTATFNGKELNPTSTLRGQGEFIVGDKSYLRLLLDDSKTQIVLGSNSTSAIDLSAEVAVQELNLIRGIARWITGNIPGLGVKTPNAAMGVRGTDFYASYNPLLGETEIICFSGKVQFTDRERVFDSKLISMNQWGGLGGRFGKKISSILTLTPEIMATFDSALPKL